MRRPPAPPTARPAAAAAATATCGARPLLGAPARKKPKGPRSRRLRCPSLPPADALSRLPASSATLSVTISFARPASFPPYCPRSAPAPAAARLFTFRPASGISFKNQDHVSQDRCALSPTRTQSTRRKAQHNARQAHTAPTAHTRQCPRCPPLFCAYSGFWVTREMIYMGRTTHDSFPFARDDCSGAKA